MKTNPVADIDIYDPDRYVAAVPYAAFRTLRQNDPVHWHAHPDGGGFWVVTRHADVVAVSRDNKTFSAERGFVLIDDLEPDLLEQTRHQLLGMDPPRHGPMRRQVIRRFTTQMVEAMIPRVRGMACDILDVALDNPDCDFIEDVTAELPTQVICSLMDIPQKDWKQIRRWSDMQTSSTDPEVVPHPDMAREASQAMGAYGYELACQRVDRDPGADLISLLLHQEVDGQRVDAMQFASLFIQITTAGNETTRGLISGGMLELMQNPAAFRQLADNWDQLPTAIEEMLRFVCPLHYFRRTALRDVELNGQLIREGDRVMMSYVSANRDEAVFEDPERLDIARAVNPQLSFGHGIHLCLGAHLARLESVLFFEEFFRRFSAIELTAEPRRIRSNLVNGMKTMPIRLKPH